MVDCILAYKNSNPVLNTTKLAITLGQWGATATLLFGGEAIALTTMGVVTLLGDIPIGTVEKAIQAKTLKENARIDYPMEQKDEESSGLRHRAPRNSGSSSD